MSQFKHTEIRGVIPAMITLFDEREAVDIRRTEAMVDFLLEKKSDGFYLTGSTGEGFLMNAEERKLVVETVVRRVNHRKPVVVHVGDMGTKKSIELAEHAWKCGADAISSVPPFYWNFSEEEIYRYYKDLAQSTPLPLIVYNIPLAGIMGRDLLLRLAEIDNVKGLKYTARSHDEMSHLKDALGAEFMIYSGCDEMALSGILSGADGIIGSFYNLFPDLYQAMYAALEQGDLSQAQRVQKLGCETIMAALDYRFPSVIRGMLGWRGVDAGYSRRPFQNHQAAELEPLRERVREIGKRYGAENLPFFQELDT